MNEIKKGSLVTSAQANEDILRRVRLFASWLPREKAATLGAIVADNPKPGHFSVMLLEDRQQIRSEVVRILRTTSFLVTFYVDEPMMFDAYLREAYPPFADGTPSLTSEEIALRGSGTSQSKGGIDSSDDENERAALPDEPIADFTDQTGRVHLTNPARFAELAQKRPSELAAIEFAHLVLWEMIQNRASDVYFQAGVRTGRISFLIDDVKQEQWTNLRLPIFMDLCRTIIGMSSAAAEQMRHSNIDNSIRLRAAVGDVDKDFELRMHSHPEAKGASLVLRSQSDLINDFEKTGMEPFQIQNLIAATRQPNGMVLLTGQTGSGKTGTLECAWHYYEQRKTRHLIEITDTLEVISSGRDQIIISESYSWDDAVRAALRSKPHVIGFGELRGARETEKAVEASMTGHLVLGTYHAGTVLRTLDRLRQMGVDIQRLAASLNLIQAQTLINKLCEGCREIDAETSRAWDRVVYKAGSGCERCRRDVAMEEDEIGYRGRTVIAESLVVSEELEDMIIADEPLKEIMNFAVAQGNYVPFAITARIKVWEGVTSVQEVSRKLGKAFDHFYGLAEWQKSEYFTDANYAQWVEADLEESTLFSRLIKLRELSRRGEAGEKEAAQTRLLDNLVRNNLTEKDIDDYEAKKKKTEPKRVVHV